MGSASLVEELAWLVKDNLHAKHLVLSVEELFVGFLECSVSDEEEKLALEPMVSYQRMLLHRLADVFGLAHESVGAGDDRHLVVEKCEESFIPAVLVSDVLVDGDAHTQHAALLSRQLLKRDTAPQDGIRTPPASSSNSSLSFEERQAAYFSARQRIFSGALKYGEESYAGTGSVRPRSDPVVARRMIAHALRNPKELSSASPSTGVQPLQNLELHSLAGGVQGNGKPSTSAVVSKESTQEVSAKAAKRMFAKALGSLHAGLSPRVNAPQSSTGTGSMLSGPEESTALNSIVPISESSTSIPANSGDIACQGGRHGVESLLSTTTRRGTRHARPGGAACRIFAQALGLPDPVCVTDGFRTDASVQYRSSLASTRESFRS